MGNGLLKEVKKGEYGHGLLIERDGHLTGRDDVIKQIREDINNHKEFVIPDKFIVSGVFQRYDALNHNGRIYPKNVLVPAIEKYINTAVATRSAFGALDHPECFTERAMVLTFAGWKYISDITEEDSVYTITEERVVEVHKVNKVIKSKYKGDMLRIKGENIDVTVTPNHKFPLFGNHGATFVGQYRADEIESESIPAMDGCVIPTTAEYRDGKAFSTYTIPAVKDDDSVIDIDLGVWLRFMACVYAFRPHVSVENGVVQYVMQSAEGVEAVEKILESIGVLDYDILDVYDIDSHVITIYSDRLATELSKNYIQGIPACIRHLDAENLGKFMSIYLSLMTIEDFSFTDRAIALGLCDVAAKASIPVTMNEVDGRYYVCRMLSNDISLAKGKISVSRVKYNDMVYCLTVHNHTFLVMDEDGNCFWSGNSSALSGHDVSHVITEMHWEGPTLVGEMELQLTPGYRKYGICSTSGDLVANMLINEYLIGVSSRAQGGVIQKFGKAYVDDSLEIIAFDVVLQPSTNCAYISPNPSDVQKFIDMDRRNPLSEALDRIEELID